ISSHRSAAARSRRSGKFRYSVACPTPARRAISYIGTSAQSANSSRAASRIASRLRWASFLLGASLVADMTLSVGPPHCVRKGDRGPRATAVVRQTGQLSPIAVYLGWCDPMSALPSTHRQVANRAPLEGRPGRGMRGRRLRLPRVGRRAATTGLFVVLSVAALAAIPGLRGVLEEVREIGPGWVAAAVALELASSISFVVVFRLFFDRLEARDARALAWTTQASGVLLPGGGAGGLAVGGWLVHLTGAPINWVVRRSAALFLLGGAISAAGLVGAGVALIAGAPGPHDFDTVVLPTSISAAVTLLVASLPVILHWRNGRPRWLASVAVGVREGQRITFRRRPSWRVLGAIGYLAFDVAVLLVLLRAVGSAPGV